MMPNLTTPPSLRPTSSSRHLTSGPSPHPPDFLPPAFGELPPPLVLALLPSSRPASDVFSCPPDLGLLHPLTSLFAGLTSSGLSIYGTNQSLSHHYLPDPDDGAR